MSLFFFLFVLFSSKTENEIKRRNRKKKKRKKKNDLKKCFSINLIHLQGIQIQVLSVKNALTHATTYRITLKRNNKIRKTKQNQDYYLLLNLSSQIIIFKNHRRTMCNN